jgi:Tfp pilus assembly protein FimT
MHSIFHIQGSRPNRSFTLMELMLSIALAALIISIGVPTFIGINRGASAKMADNQMYSYLKFAQEQAVITRQRVGFFIVTSVINSNRWVSSSMTNRAFFVMADVTPGVARQQNFLTEVQVLPSPMIFDLTGSTLTSATMIDNDTLVPVFTVRYFRFAPAGAVFAVDADRLTNGLRRFDVVIAEGMAVPGGGFTQRVAGTAIRYTNSVNVFTGRVFKP